MSWSTTPSRRSATALARRRAPRRRGGTPRPRIGSAGRGPTRSGYVQAVHARTLLSHAERHGVSLRLRPRIERTRGGRDDAGMDLAHLAERPRSGCAGLLPGPRPGRPARIRTNLRAGAPGSGSANWSISRPRHSPAVNDPYTAIQALQHLSVIFCALARAARRPRGSEPRRRHDHHSRLAILAQYLAVACGLIRRYGAREPTVAQAMLRLLADSAAVVHDEPERFSAIGSRPA